MTLVADPPFNVISPTSPYLAMWDTVQTESSDIICWGSCVNVCMRLCYEEVRMCTEPVYVCTLVCVLLRGRPHTHTKLGASWIQREPLKYFDVP